MKTEYFFHNQSDRKEVFVKEKGFHLYDALFLVKSGNFICNMQGKTFVAGPNDAVLFKANVYFERKILAPLAYYQTGFFTREGGNLYSVLPSGLLPLNKEYTLLLDSDFRRAGSDEDGKFYIAELTKDALVRSALHLLKTEPSKPADADIEYCKQYFHEHISEKISVGHMAKILGLTHNGLIWKFRRTENMTPSEYLSSIRLQLGKDLLTSTSLRIGEIADSCGFSSAYYFSTSFGKKYGISPTAWRKQAIDESKS